MFIDEAVIEIAGGHGGAGRVAFYANRKGASGGAGGRGGNVYAVASSNVTHLKKFTEITKYEADNGGIGSQNKRSGANGQDVFLKVPLGTSIIDTKTGWEVTLDANFPEILLCRGGIGGHGNVFFKSSTNRTPRQAEPGEPGDRRKVKLILKLIADYGLIGLPNAGKSSLLNLLTAANVRTANYPFTTLEPNLGVFEGRVIADVPGLIEGASTGKGLGIKFLKHIEKVKLLLHCISAESEDAVAEYKTVVQELTNYNTKLLSKKSVILLTKTDLVDDETVKKQMKLLKKHNKNLLPISIYKEESIKKLKDLLTSNSSV
jgi:GTP-binding protein